MRINNNDIRKQNEAIILKHIILEKEVSRAELSVLTNLNKASVSNVTKDLLERDLIIEERIGDASKSGGRKPIMLIFNPKCATTISIDIGPKYIEGDISFIGGQSIETSTVKKVLDVTQDNVISLVKDMINYFLKQNPKTTHGMIGICIGIHGLVDNNKVILHTPNYKFPKDFYEELTQTFDCPIYLNNEANLSALGEYTFSSNSDNLVSLNIHTGVGAGIVNNGVLYKGDHGNAGEIGHSILIVNGTKCSCGNSGCLEKYVSHQSLFENIANKIPDISINSKKVIELFHDGNPIVIEELQKHSEYLGITLNNISTIYDPQTIIVNSSIYREIPELLTTVKHNLKKSIFFKETHVRTSSLNKKATLLGGTAFIAQQFLNIDHLKFDHH